MDGPALVKLQPDEEFSSTEASETALPRVIEIDLNDHSCVGELIVKPKDGDEMVMKVLYSNIPFR